MQFIYLHYTNLQRKSFDFFFISRILYSSNTHEKFLTPKHEMKPVNYKKKGNFKSYTPVGAMFQVYSHNTVTDIPCNGHLCDKQDIFLPHPTTQPSQRLHWLYWCFIKRYVTQSWCTQVTLRSVLKRC